MSKVCKDIKRKAKNAEFNAIEIIPGFPKKTNGFAIKF